MDAVFYTSLDELVVQECSACHEASEGIAFSLGSTPEARFQEFRKYAVAGNPEESQFYTIIMDDDEHGGGAIFDEGSDEMEMLAAWVNGGLLFSPENPTPAAPAAGVAAGTGEKPSGKPEGIPEPLGDGTFVGGIPKTSGLGGINHFLEPFQINGRFDINYERRNYSDNPFSSDATDALISYHNFLFVSRQAKDDPFGFTAEVTSLQFWEAYLAYENTDWRLVLKGGKLLVPFGPEPTFHRYYGGLVAFDQRVTPAIWAQEGVSGTVQYRAGRWTFNNDLYAVRGYALRSEDAILDLRSDFSPTDNAKIAIGDRFGVSYGPFSAWYSIYAQTLGFGRVLFMQGLDFSLWRARGIPVLENFSIGLGALRADVSGGDDIGGPGDDYYHFASYFQAYYYIGDYLFLRYRQGLRTFGNKKGSFYDERLYTADDGSTQHVGLGFRYRGLSGGIFHFWNFEKVDEFDNDFLRVTLAYEF